MPKVADTKENLDKCVCGKCPTYDDCAREKMELLYCAKGVSSCALEEKGCICGTCPVHSENQLVSGYFCTKGAAE